ncbi:MAG: adenylate/guanylate cyclase domain-containing protein [Alphaproteobacteria bacterium]
MSTPPPRRAAAVSGRRFTKLWGSPRLQACLLLVLALGLRLLDPAPLEALRLQTFDLLQRSQSDRAADQHVAIVDIDEESLARLGQWPWPRTEIALLVDHLLEAGAVAVGFDMLFAEPDRLSPALFAASARGLSASLRSTIAAGQDNDAVLAETIGAAPVVLGVSATHQSDHPYADRRYKVTTAIEQNGDPRPFLLSYGAVIRNLGVLEDAAAGRGMITLSSERDGLVRRVPAVLRVDQDIYPTLAVELVRVALQRPQYRVVTGANGGGVERLRLGRLDVPTDINGLVWLRHLQHDPSLYLPAADIMQNRFDRRAVAGKIVLVGTSAVGLRDLRATPVSAAIPGVEIHAQLVDAILNQDFLTRPNYAIGLEMAVTALIGLIVITLVPRASSLTSLPIIAAVLGLLAGASWYLFDARALLFDPSYAILTAAALFSWLIYGNYSRVEAQKRQVRAAFGQYLAPALVERLVSDPDQLELGGEQREMTFLFTDIADFTSFAESMQPTVLVSILNAYLDAICRIVMEHGGTIDKIVGDAIHAIFNAPLDQPDHARRAVLCGLAIDAFGQQFAASMRDEGHDFGRTRIGINTGSCVVGNFGGSQRFDYTAHGDAINTAARLEGVNKHLGTTICVAASTADQCPDLHFRPIGRLFLKGKTKGLMAFEPITGEEAGSPQNRAYCAAFTLLEREDEDSRKAFDGLAADHPDDALIALHHRRLAEHQTGADIVLDKK